MRKPSLLLLCLALLGCDDGPVDPRGGDVTVVTLGRAVTVGASGGSLSTADEAVSLTFPAGALSSDVAITISAIDPAVPGVEEWSRAVELGPDGTTFDTPVTLSLAVDPLTLPADLPAAALRIYTLGERGWEEVPGSTASADFVVSAEIEHFSAYSVQVAPNAVRKEGDEILLKAGETISYGGFFFEYRAASGEVYPAAYQAVRWESSEPDVLELAEAVGPSDAEGRAGSPRLHGRSHGTGVLRATNGTVTGSIDFSVSGVADISGTYVLESVGGKPLPALGTGELLHDMTIVLMEDGSCTFGGRVQPAQEDPDGAVEDFAFQSCSYAFYGTNLDLKVGDPEEGEESLTAQIVNGQIVLPILIQDDTDPSDEGVMGDAIFVKE